MIDLLYLAWNRRAFTVASLAALEANTDWSQVRRCWLYDDGSTDGTLDLLTDFAAGRDRVEVVTTALRSPVAIMNDFLSLRQPAPWFAKIDSDTIVPPGWLGELGNVLWRNPTVDLLGIEAKCPLDGDTVRRGIVPTDHIGGIGLMRTSVFTDLPVANGRLGFSDWQIKHPDVFKAWITPALPVILLDRLPFEPWRGLSLEYERRGWQRPWKLDSDPRLWAWWNK